MPPPVFSNLRQRCRHRGKVHPPTERMRKRTDKILKREEAGIGGLLTEIFDLNGRLVLHDQRLGCPAAESMAVLMCKVSRDLAKLVGISKAELALDSTATGGR